MPTFKEDYSVLPEPSVEEKRKQQEAKAAEIEQAAFDAAANTKAYQMKLAKENQENLDKSNNTAGWTPEHYITITKPCTLKEFAIGRELLVGNDPIKLQKGAVYPVFHKNHASVVEGDTAAGAYYVDFGGSFGKWYYIGYRQVYGWIDLNDTGPTDPPKLAVTKIAVDYSNSEQFKEDMKKFNNASATTSSSGGSPSTSSNQAVIDRVEVELKSTAVQDEGWTKYQPSTGKVNLDERVEQGESASVDGTNYISALYNMPGFSRAKMSLTALEEGRKKTYDFEFIIGPSSQTESHGINVNPIQTGGGFIIVRSGPQLSRMSLSGYFLNSKEMDERRSFLDNYFNAHLKDKVNAFHEYFNDSLLSVELNGYLYTGIITNLELSQTVENFFTFRYNMSMLVTSQTAMGKPINKSSTTPKVSQAATDPNSTVGSKEENIWEYDAAAWEQPDFASMVKYLINKRGADRLYGSFDAPASTASTGETETAESEE